MMGVEIGRDLLGQLRLESNHLREERELLLKERDCLIKQDLDGILEVLKEKETLQLKGKILEESRVAMKERIKGAVGGGGDEGESLFQRLLNVLESSYKEELTDSREELEKLVGEVEYLSAGNQYLIRSTLGRIEGAIGLLMGLEGKGLRRYNMEGRLEAAGPSKSTLLQEA